MNPHINPRKYKYIRYNPAYPRLFAREKARLKVILRGLEIEHVGSSSVPGLGGKGIIDIAVKVARKEVRKCMKKLMNKGYEYRIGPGDDKRKLFQRIIKYRGKERRIHVHLTHDKNMWNSFIAFRDHMRINKQDREKYAKIKMKAALVAKGDGKKYWDIKNKVLREIAIKALKSKI